MNIKAKLTLLSHISKSYEFDSVNGTYFVAFYVPAPWCTAVHRGVVWYMVILARCRFGALARSGARPNTRLWHGWEPWAAPSPLAFISSTKTQIRRQILWCVQMMKRWRRIPAQSLTASTDVDKGSPSRDDCWCWRKEAQKASSSSFNVSEGFLVALSRACSQIIRSITGAVFRKPSESWCAGYRILAQRMPAFSVLLYVGSIEQLARLVLIAGCSAIFMRIWLKRCNGVCLETSRMWPMTLSLVLSWVKQYEVATRNIYCFQGFRSEPSDSPNAFCWASSLSSPSLDTCHPSTLT